MMYPDVFLSPFVLLIGQVGYLGFACCFAAVCVCCCESAVMWWLVAVLLLLWLFCDVLCI